MKDIDVKNGMNAAMIKVEEQVKKYFDDTRTEAIFTPKADQ